MTRNEYMDALNHALHFLDADARDAAIGFYAEMLSDRMEEGQSEEEAVAAMENVNVIADRMRQEYRSKKPASDSDEDIFTPCTITYAESDLCSLQVRFLDRAVILEPADGKELVITYMENEKKPLEYSEQDGHIQLIEHEPMRGNARTFFGTSLGNVLDSLFRSAPAVDTMVHIKVPCDTLLSMNIQTTNGKITLSRLSGMGEIILHSSNGSLHIEQVRCKRLNAQTSNARIALDHVSGIDAITVKSSNGRIQAGDLYSHGVIDLRTSNARIITEQSTGDDMLFMQTSNGHIETRSCRFPHLQMKTSNGGISGTIPGSMEDYSIDSRTSNGFSNLPQHRTGGSRSISAHTSNGTISITFEQE